MKKFGYLLALCLVVSPVAGVPVIGHDYEVSLTERSSPAGLKGKHGAVATEQVHSFVAPARRACFADGRTSSRVKTCSNIGVKLLQEGGNAADAIIGAQLCVGVRSGI